MSKDKDLKEYKDCITENMTFITIIFIIIASGMLGYLVALLGF
jgi:hypothetical protein